MTKFVIVCFTPTQNGETTKPNRFYWFVNRSPKFKTYHHFFTFKANCERIQNMTRVFIAIKVFLKLRSNFTKDFRYVMFL